MMIDTSPWSSCSRRSPWLACSGHTISSTGPSVSPFWDFWRQTFIFHMQEFTTLFISRRIAGSYQLFPQVGLSSCSSLPTTTSSARSPALTSSSLRLVGLSSCSCLPTTTSSARSPAQTSPHLVEAEPVVFFPRDFPKKF